MLNSLTLGRSRGGGRRCWGNGRGGGGVGGGGSGVQHLQRLLVDEEVADPQAEDVAEVLPVRALQQDGVHVNSQGGRLLAKEPQVGLDRHGVVAEGQLAS